LQTTLGIATFVIYFGSGRYKILLYFSLPTLWLRLPVWRQKSCNSI